MVRADLRGEDGVDVEEEHTKQVDNSAALACQYNNMVARRREPAEPWVVAFVEVACPTSDRYGEETLTED